MVSPRKAKAPSAPGDIHVRMTSMSPLAMVCLLQSYYRSDIEFDTPAEIAAVDYLVARGLARETGVRSTTANIRQVRRLTPTTKGTFYIKMLLKVPLPVQVTTWMHPDEAPDSDEDSL